MTSALTPTNAKIDRNARLLSAWRSGRYHSIAALARQFRLSRQAAWRILQRAEIRQQAVVEADKQSLPV